MTTILVLALCARCSLVAVCCGWSTDRRAEAGSTAAQCPAAGAPRWSRSPPACSAARCCTPTPTAGSSRSTWPLGRPAVTRAAGTAGSGSHPMARWLAMHIGSPFVPPCRPRAARPGTGQITRPLHRPDFAVAPPAWSPDSRTLAVCDAESTAELWSGSPTPPGRVTPRAPRCLLPGIRRPAAWQIRDLGGSRSPRRPDARRCRHADGSCSTRGSTRSGPAAPGGAAGGAGDSRDRPARRAAADHTVVLSTARAGSPQPGTPAVIADTVALLDDGGSRPPVATDRRHPQRRRATC